MVPADQLDSGWGKVKSDPILGSVILTLAVPDPQSWMALLRKEIGHFHEKKELSLDTRYSEGCGGWAVVPRASELLGLPSGP